MTLQEYWQKYAIPNAEKALTKSGLKSSISNTPIDLADLLDTPNAVATPLQKFTSGVNGLNTPQMWVLEDITGSGKTEAAMLLVNRMMAADQADGCYIGLPTMATADGMYRRMASNYRMLFADDQMPSLVLAHGSRHLSSLFRSSILDIETGQSFYSRQDETGAAQCVKWLADNRKKALLADIGVGTVDQALLSILPSKHQSMRLFGLGSKILVVDEVHAYDAYMFPLLGRLLNFQAQIGGSAILLSATLPKKMLFDLSQAFQKGLGESTIQIPQKRLEYPLATVVTKKGAETHPAPASNRSIRRLPVKLCHEKDAVIKDLKTKSEKGHCACWIRNTVWDACDTYRYFIANKLVDPSKLILFHARFTLGDRLKIEKQVIDSFGKHSTSEDRAGKVLISSPVIENSLDICLDSMATDLAPIDLVIQRAGRQHRHIRDRCGNLLAGKDALDQREPPVLNVLSPDPLDYPNKSWYSELFPKAAYVYPHVGNLWLTARMLAAKKEIDMPFALRELIEGVYAEEFEPIPENLLEASEDAVTEAMCKTNLGKYNALTLEEGYDFGSGEWDEDIHVPTRLGEEDHTICLARLENDILAVLSG